jgi:uncharacterized damage-inducible protein DinB
MGEALEDVTGIAEQFVDSSRRYFSSVYLPKIERCLEAVTEEDVWWRPNPASNSIGNLLLHLTGSVRQWVVGGVGDSPVERDRQQEFDERTPIPRSELIGRLRQAVAEADAALANLDGARLGERRQIRGEDLTLLDAVYHAVEHFSMHSGQIFMLAKMRTGKDLKLYE